MRKEAEIQAEARLILGQRPGCAIFRNNRGKLKDRQGRWVEFGLCNGASDLIGWQSLIVTPDMVGKTLAIFTAVECKKENGRESLDQIRFGRAVIAAGGKYVVYRGNPEVLKS